MKVGDDIMVCINGMDIVGEVTRISNDVVVAQIVNHEERWKLITDSTMHKMKALSPLEIQFRELGDYMSYYIDHLVVKHTSEDDVEMPLTLKEFRQKKINSLKR